VPAAGPNPISKDGLPGGQPSALASAGTRPEHLLGESTFYFSDDLPFRRLSRVAGGIMQLTFTGWAKDHGLKTMLSKTLREEQIVEDPFQPPMSKGEVKAKVLRPDEDMADGIRIYFSSEMRLGGSQLGQLQISTKELMRMVKACIAERPVEAVVKLYNEC
jgi:hypothetical protein